jgi:hypothetical protein
VHLTGTPIWCDARRRRDVCFVSSADRVVRAGHGQLIGTPTTIALIAGQGSGHLAVPVRRPFTLGTLRLELIPSGRAVGAAALHVDAGAIRTVNAGEAADVRASDAVVIAAPIGEPQHRLAPIDTIADQLIVWSTAQLAAGKRPVLVVDSALDGIEVAAKLIAGNVAVAGSKLLRDAAEIIGAPALRAPGKDAAVTIRAEADRIKAPPQPVIALVSARAVDPQPGWDATFAWPFVASREQLLTWIEQARAKQVFVTGAAAESIVAALGARAQVLGPPQQMALFSS